MATRQKQKTLRKNAATAAKPLSRPHPAPPALSGWLNSQRNLGEIDPTAVELARSIKRSFFAE